MKTATIVLITCLLALTARADDYLWYPYPSDLGADSYDVVAYFTDKQAVRGLTEFSADYGNITWHFPSSKNRDMFITAPANYVPYYGGYCAYAAAQNALAFCDPEEWTVHNGKLYFNYNLPPESVGSGKSMPTLIVPTIIGRG